METRPYLVMVQSSQATMIKSTVEKTRPSRRSPRRKRKPQRPREHPKRSRRELRQTSIQIWSRPTTSWLATLKTRISTGTMRTTSRTLIRICVAKTKSLVSSSTLAPLTGLSPRRRCLLRKKHQTRQMLSLSKSNPWVSSAMPLSMSLQQRVCKYR